MVNMRIDLYYRRTSVEKVQVDLRAFTTGRNDPQIYTWTSMNFYISITRLSFLVSNIQF